MKRVKSEVHAFFFILKLIRNFFITFAIIMIFYRN